MSSAAEQLPRKRDFFPNDDFERTVQDIISSPRKGKHYQDDSTIYDITSKQQKYYTKCFLHLMKSTQKYMSASGALFGGDEKVVDFFRKSGLDDEELSRIWALSDVNEDGWLDLAEFRTAMHLIVLRVKGELPVPPVLPPSLRPPITAPRTQSQVSSESSRRSEESHATGDTVQHREHEETTQPCHTIFRGQMPTSSRSEEHLVHEPQLAQFSDVPPLLVDGRPTAIKALPLRQLPDAVLSLRSPLGPPPVPPPRPTGRGHMRSASLDLKQLAVGQAPLYTSAFSVTAPRTARNVICQTTVDPKTDADVALDERHVSEDSSGAVPHRNISSVALKPIANLLDAAVQTDAQWVDPATVQKFIAEFGSQLQDMMGNEVVAEEGGTVLERWTRRVEGLRQQNVELERERARLAQIRVQLELRLQELSSKGNSANHCQSDKSAGSTKPTPL